MPLATINPATGRTVRLFPELSRAEIDAKLDAAGAAFRLHRRSPLAERSERLRTAAALFESEQEPLARLMALEMGKPLAQGRAEAVKCATACRYYAEHGAAMLQNEVVDKHSHIRHEPLGPVLALMPWNYPLWQVVRFAAPSLMAGNVGLLKHADNVPQCGTALENLFLRAGFAAGCFQYLAVPVAGVTGLIDDPRIVAVTLTGSVAAGRAVAAAAGARLKRTVLELGGSDPFVVLPSADLDAAVAAAIQSRTQNSGQSCIAAKRFLVHEAVYDRFTAALVKGFGALRVGDPLAPNTDLGPLAQARGLETLQRQMRDALAAGATVLTGGTRHGTAGYYFPPTVLAGLPPDAPVAREEWFGPVALLFPTRTLNEALALANDTDFGLGASVWTRDEGERQCAIEALETGQVFLNAMVASSPELPFGGIKQSGFGRELGRAGLLAFTNPKSVRAAEKS